MIKSILTALAVAVVVGCAKDDGSGDFEKGAAAHAAGDLNAAAEHFASAAAKNPTNLASRVKLAVVDMELGEMAAARAAADAAVAVDPQSAEAVLASAQVAYYEKDYARARKLFGALTSAAQLPAEMRSQAYSELAVLEIADNKTDSARIALWRALKINFKNAAAWYHLGHLSRDTYHFGNAALEQFEMAGRLMKDPERASDVVRKTIPSLRESLRAKMASKPGASKRDPAASAKLVAEGEALEKKDAKKAAAKYADAYAKDPLSYEAAFKCAKSVAASAKTDSAVDKALLAFQDAIDARPNSQETYRTAAAAATKFGRHIRAEKFLSQALAHDPKEKTTLKAYAQTLRRLGRQTDAKLYESYLKEL